MALKKLRNLLGYKPKSKKLRDLEAQLRAARGDPDLQFVIRLAIWRQRKKEGLD